MLNKFKTTSNINRIYPEVDDKRHPFERDRDRVIHSIAFRRLQYKTQVFINSEGDHYRTRLTHSLEVAQIARSIARRLQLNEDLAEVVSLAHDLGHPPFGHNGEYALQEVAKVYGGFDHNAQALRILCYLENRYPQFDGLNLTPQTIDGLIKHNGPCDLKQYAERKGTNASDSIAKIAKLYNINLQNQTLPEGQIAAIADDIAYCSHDVDDGVRAGLISIDEIMGLKPIADLMQGVDFTNSRAIYAMVRRLTSHMIEDIISNSLNNIKKHKINTIDDFIDCKVPIIALSDQMLGAQKSLKKLLFSRIYNSTKDSEIGKQSKLIVQTLFQIFMEDPQKLPNSWQERLDQMEKSLVILDYISGMTDRYAAQKFALLTKI